jgi:hypothetical protein
LEAFSVASLQAWTPQDTKNYSRVLQEFIRGFDLLDLRGTSQERATYTQYTSREAWMIDKIYGSKNLRSKKRGVETRFAAYTDHLAVVILIVLEANTMLHGRSYWKINTVFLCEEIFQEHLRQRWTEWSRHSINYHNMVM